MSIISEIPNHDPLHSIYFYYLQYDEAQEAPALLRVYYHFDEDTPIEDDADLIRLITKLGDNARADDYAPPPCGDSISSVPWRRKCYVVFLLDDLVHKFPSKNSLKIDFVDTEEPINHSFFNARKLNIDLSGDGAGEVVTALSCINLMQHEDGRDLEDDEEEEFDVTLSTDGHVLRFRDDDDGGTNQGGPLPPPARL